MLSPSLSPLSPWDQTSSLVLGWRTDTCLASWPVLPNPPMDTQAFLQGPPSPQQVLSKPNSNVLAQSSSPLSPSLGMCRDVSVSVCACACVHVQYTYIFIYLHVMLARLHRTPSPRQKLLCSQFSTARQPREARGGRRE